MNRRAISRAPTRPVAHPGSHESVGLIAARMSTVLVMALALAGCGPESTYLVRESTVAAAAATVLPPRGVSPTWHAATEGVDGADDIVFLSETTVLLSTIKLQGIFMAQSPVAGEFLAVDAGSGRKLWNVPRGAEPYELSHVVTTAPALWVRRAMPTASGSADPCELSRLSPADGSVLSRVAYSCGDIVLDADVSHLATLSSGGLRLVKLDTGAVVWTNPVRGSRLIRAGSSFVVADDGTVVRVDATSGRTTSTVNLRRQLEDVVPTEDGELVALSRDGENSLLALLPLTGPPAWERKVRGSVSTVQVTGDGVLVGLVGPNALVSLQRGSGEVRWQQEIPGAPVDIRRAEMPVQSAPAPATTKRSGQRATAPLPPASRVVALVLTSPQVGAAFLRGYDAQDGKEVFASPIPDVVPPPFSQPTSRLAPRFVDGTSSLYVLGPGGMGAVDLAAGNIANGRDFRGSFRFSVTPTLKEPELTARRSRATLFSSGLDLSPRVSQSVYPKPATQAQAQANAAAAGAATTVALASMVMEAQAQAAEQGRNAGLANEARVHFRLSSNARVYQLATQGRFVVRPIAWTWGEGLVVVDLASGKWSELVTGPPEHIFANYLLQPPAFAVSPSGSLLVTLAVPRDPARWIESSQYPLFRGLQREIVGFKLDAASFHPAATYATSSLVEPWGEVLDVY